jgi:hypothetical protein
MNNRANWQVGGITSLIGGVGAIVVNILHPPPPARTDELLILVASVPYWTIMHYLAALAAVSIVSGMALLVRSLQDARAHALGEVGKYVTTLGGAALAAPWRAGPSRHAQAAASKAWRSAYEMGYGCVLHCVQHGRDRHRETLEQRRGRLRPARKNPMLDVRGPCQA